MPPGSLSRAGVVFWVLLFPLLAIVPGLMMGLHADDWFLTRPQSLAGVLATFGGDWNAGERGIGGFYRPLVRVTFHLDRLLTGNSPWGLHLTNGLLFAGVVAATWSLAARLFPASTAGLFAALLVLLTPLKNEALFWVSGRTDLVAGALAFWALVLWVRRLDGGGPRHAGGALVCLLLACMGKETALPMGLVMALGWALLSRDRTSWRLGLLAPLLVAVGFFAFRQMLLGGLGGYRAEEPRTAWLLAEGILRSVSALACPWQCGGAGAFSITVGILGTTLLGIWLWLLGFPRVECWLAASTLILLVPLVFAPPSVADGTRLLIPGIVTSSVLMAGIFRGVFGRGLMVVGLVAMQPSNLSIMGEFIRAGRIQAAIVDVAVDHIAEKGSGTYVFPVPARMEHRRILDPGLDLDHAVITRLMIADPALSATSLMNESQPIPATLLESASRRIVVAGMLFPEFDEGEVIRVRGDAVVSAPFTRSAELDAGPRRLVAAHLVADSGPRSAALEVGDWSTEAPFHRVGEESHCWLTTIDTPFGVAGPVNVSVVPVGLSLRRLELVAFDLGQAKRLMP